MLEDLPMTTELSNVVTFFKTAQKKFLVHWWQLVQSWVIKHWSSVFVHSSVCWISEKN